jgi:Ca2+:H+ antiporter
MRWILRLGYITLPLAFLSHFLLGRIASTHELEPLLTFLLSGVSVIPLAQLMGESTAQLAERTGPTIGGLLNATFGNAAELIIGIIAMYKGLDDVVKATLTGSILGNLLLVAGAAMVVGGAKRERQHFSRASAQTSIGLLAVAVTGMLFPAIFHFTLTVYSSDVNLAEHEAAISVGSSAVLIAVYICGLIFTLKTHRHIFSMAPSESADDPVIGLTAHGMWSLKKSIWALVIASVLTALVAELLVGSVEKAAVALHWNRLFVGVIVLALFGNAAEHSTAVMLAYRNDMDTAMTITYQSSLQIALFATPFLVLLSAVLTASGFTHTRLDLIFSPMEVAAVLLTVAVVTVISLNGESNWFEGVLLLAVYAILGITFFYMPVSHPAQYNSHPPTPAAEVNHDATR